MKDSIIIQRAREHNLKSISLQIPKNQLVVLTGPSGSGKSTLALDTLQRECQRQYMESMGMTTDSVSKPKVDSITGLSPSISINQHVTNRNPRSTVGTITDMYTFLRVLYEKLGERSCPSCENTIHPIIDKEEFEDHPFKQYQTCPHCKHRFEKLTRSHFSFNKPEGACLSCDGLGHVAELQTSLVFNDNQTIQDDGVTIWKGQLRDYQISILQAATRYYEIDIDLTLPLKQWNTLQKDLLYYGVESAAFMAHFPDKQPPKTVGQGKFEGVLTSIWRRYKEKGGLSGEAQLFYTKTCPTCNGERLKSEARKVKMCGQSITALANRSLEEVLQWLNELKQSLSTDHYDFTETIIHDFKTKLTRIMKVGLGYLTLDRQTITLSGGEAQRLRLAIILGSGLTGVLYILDEPTAGLHPKDTDGLITIMQHLRDLGNTVLLIEHDRDVMRSADHIIDIGPGAGKFGGTIVGEGSPTEIINQPSSITGSYLKHTTQSPDRSQYRQGDGHYLTIHHATKHNLKNITAKFPLQCFIAVTGVSGSGKSSLVFDILSTISTKGSTGYERITGLEHIKNLVTVSQAPLTRMQRSNVATYTDVFSFIRHVYAALPLAKECELKPKDFSFNTVGGRCEPCQGLGFVTTNMHFLPDVEVTCPACKGKRFKDQILSVTFKGYSISELLDMSIAETQALFQDHKKIAPIINLLCEIGLGYLNWGQSVTTLSGGEGQRLKLAKELYKQKTGHTLYILDEPTTGLHQSDIKQLLLLLNRLVDAGNTVIVVEHTIEVIAQADWIIDMGPEGGERGGEIVVQGTPKQIALTPQSYTGRYLKSSHKQTT
ncbi:excinuclease ABC subunit UvrA [Halalkalibacter sp. AB-rgal2]|uniref:excinuclease ABC subunit UvrA n=1 Tax=Halalkalibacter sp. AB-rgal2 TaxID=3242695 RepID=UPI00359EE997